jgi:hypothetical protein
MGTRNTDYLKSKFETGDRPSEQDFIDLIDSTHNDTLSSLCLSISGGTIKAGVEVKGSLYTNEIYTVGKEGSTTLATSYSGDDSGSARTWQFMNGLYIKSALPYIPVDLSPTPSISVSPTVTPSITVSPTVTPSITVTPTVTPSNP